jgi:DNA-binding GntR family transcriptional regulator
MRAELHLAVKRMREEQMSMREIVYAHIQKKIASRMLRAGDPVSELPIAKELGVSRTPTREAIRQLIAEGLLEEVPGRGVLVVTLDRRDVVEIYELRRALEVQAVETVAKRLLGPEIEGLHKIAGEIPRLVQELRKSGRDQLDEEQMIRFEAADIGFHAYILQAAGNRRSLRIVSSSRSLIRIFARRRTGHDIESLNRIHADHCELMQAIEAHDAARAAAIAAAHVEASQRARLDEFDQREKESALPRDIGAFLDRIRAELA